MPFNTLSVASAVTPSVIETYFSHYLNRKPLKQKPTAHISYHEGLRLIRQFLDYSSKHTVEDLQAFTAQWVPVPSWVRIQDVEVPPQFLHRSANVLRKQLGSNGIERVGGEKWWMWRLPDSPLRAEWIEMKKDYNERNRAGTKCDRVILYVHGGAYYFGSVDEHRYQMQRHARKLKARVLAPRYRLAPGFPFPCGLYDCIATYFYLLEHFDSTQILFAGDSAGGGMVLSMLVTLRDQGCPLPAGTILISPWVDLTHSFPSVSGDGAGDYIPPHGFHHKPSMAWPPPPTSEEKPQTKKRFFTQPVEQPFDMVELPATYDTAPLRPSKQNLRAESQATSEGKQDFAPNTHIPGMGPRLAIPIDDKLLIIREQFQMYAPNDLLSHPLVSPVQQPSLGGLPPMLIQVGGGELLRDEQIYLAHKAANPRAYPPSDAVLNEYDPQRIVLNQYPPTDVQLQVWEDLCHVPHTLSFTRPAKYMFRSVAQFGAWALARAQHKSIGTLDADAVSIISEDGEPDDFSRTKTSLESFGSIGADGITSTQSKLPAIGTIGKAGDELPPFTDHMIRQRVSRHGIIFPLPRASDIECLHLDRNTIGALKTGPVRKWLSKRAEHDQKFASEFKKLAKKKAKEAKGYDKPEPGESPPVTALINRRSGGHAPERKKQGKSWGLAMWTGWGSSHDENTIEREQKFHDARENVPERPVSVAMHVEGPLDPSDDDSANVRSAAAVMGINLSVPSPTAEGVNARRRSSASANTILASSRHSKRREDASPRSPHRQVVEQGQASHDTSSPASPTVSSRSFWDLSRRSSAASGNVKNAPHRASVAPSSSSLNPRSRPGGMRTASEEEGMGTPGSFSSSATAPSAASTTASAAPSLYDTGKEAVVRGSVPDSAYTFLLNPGVTRPPNGSSGSYPFVQQQQQQNNHHQYQYHRNNGQSPNRSTRTLHSAGQSDGEAGREVTGWEVPAVELPAISATFPGELQAIPSTSTSDAERAPSPLVPPATMDDTDSPIQRTTTGDRPASALLSNPLSALHIKPVHHDPPSPSEDSLSPSSIQQPYHHFKSRDSRFGQLGADGMPTSAFPESGVATHSAARPPPFKVRNPVFDARAAAASASSNVPAVQHGQATDATRAAPFKMRHTIYDSKVAPLGSKAPSPKSEQTSVPPLPQSASAPALHTANGSTSTVNPPSRASSPFATPASRASRASSIAVATGIATASSSNTSSPVDTKCGTAAYNSHNSQVKHPPPPHHNFTLPMTTNSMRQAAVTRPPPNSGSTTPAARPPPPVRKNTSPVDPLPTIPTATAIRSHSDSLTRKPYHLPTSKFSNASEVLPPSSISAYSGKTRTASASAAASVAQYSSDASDRHDAEPPLAISQTNPLPPLPTSKFSYSPQAMMGGGEASGTNASGLIGRLTFEKN